jgi:alanine racemase
MIDVTGISAVQEGDEVIIFGNLVARYNRLLNGPKQFLMKL